MINQRANRILVTALPRRQAEIRKSPLAQAIHAETRLQGNRAAEHYVLTI